MKDRGFIPAPIGFRHRRNQLVRGFTLVEILISLVILGMGLIVLFNIFPLGLQSISYSHKLNEVSLFAQRKLEEMKSTEQVGAGKTSGKEGDLNWQITTAPLKLEGAIEVISVELDVDFEFLGSQKKQRFVTYVLGD